MTRENLTFILHGHRLPCERPSRWMGRHTPGLSGCFISNGSPEVS